MRVRTFINISTLFRMNINKRLITKKNIFLLVC